MCPAYTIENENSLKIEISNKEALLKLTLKLSSLKITPIIDKSREIVI